MILITGGLGFIGSHTARALLDQGESCIVTRHRHGEIPQFLQADLGGRLIVEPLELDDGAALGQIGKRHSITGIVHLADTAAQRLWRPPSDSSPLRLDGLFDGLGRVLAAAADWRVPRVTIASTIGVYGGLQPGMWSEDMSLAPLASHAIPTAKRCSELLGGYASGQFGLDVVFVRPSAVWGPGGRAASRFFQLPALVHAALRGQSEAVEVLEPEPTYAQDGGDLCYVKDCARAIALIQTAKTLAHSIYNVGSGHLTTTAEIVAAIHDQVPDARLTLVDGRNPRSAPEDPYLDLTRIQKDTGYQPTYDISRGIADYVAWLRAGHSR